MSVAHRPLTLLRALALGLLIAGALLAVILWPAPQDPSPKTGWLILALWLGVGAALGIIVALIEKTRFYARSELSRPVLFK